MKEIRIGLIISQYANNCNGPPFNVGSYYKLPFHLIVADEAEI